MQTKIGQLYITPWKSLIIKGIDHTDRKYWDHVLGKYRINVRHASNELNWQIEDNCEEGLSLKRYLIRQFDKEDLRTFGLCFAIKTQPNTGLFGSIIIRKLSNVSANQRRMLDRYDILYTKDFNPNSKDFVVFRKNIEKDNLAVYLVSLCKYFYSLQSKQDLIGDDTYRQETILNNPLPEPVKKVFQCKHCLTIYDTEFGDEINGIMPGTSFSDISDSYECQTCNAPKDDFVEVVKMSLIV
jgi:rubredoxin